MWGAMLAACPNNAGAQDGDDLENGGSLLASLQILFFLLLHIKSLYVGSRTICSVYSYLPVDGESAVTRAVLLSLSYLKI